MSMNELFMFSMLWGSMGRWVLGLSRECNFTVKLLDQGLLNPKPLNPKPRNP